MSLVVALVIFDDARHRRPTRACPEETSRCSQSCFPAPPPPPAFLLSASPAPRLACMRQPRSLPCSLAPPALTARIFRASLACGLGFLRLARSQPRLSAPPPLPPCLVFASFGSSSFEVYRIGSETLHTSSTPPLAPCATRRSRPHNAESVPWCSSLRAWRCVVHSTSELVEGPTDGRESWTRVLSLSSTLSPHSLSPGILETLSVMVRVVYLLWRAIQLACVPLRGPVHAPLLARRSMGHRETRMTCHAPVRTGAAVLAGWGLD